MFQEIRFQVNLREQELLDQVEKAGKEIADNVADRLNDVKDKFEKTTAAIQLSETAL